MALPRLKVSPVVVAVVQMVPLFPVNVHVPEPIVMVRVLEFEEENKPAVKFLPLASKVPLVRVTVRVEPTTISSANCQVPPTPLKVIGKSSVLPLLVMVLVPEVAAKVVALAPAVKVMPEETVKLP